MYLDRILRFTPSRERTALSNRPSPSRRAVVNLVASMSSRSLWSDWLASHL